MTNIELEQTKDNFIKALFVDNLVIWKEANYFHMN